MSSTTAVTVRPLDTALTVLDAPAGPADLTAEDRARVEQIKQSLDLMSSTSVLAFGTRSEQQVADFADSVLEQVMRRDLGPVHDRLGEIKAIASGLDAERLKGGGLLDRLLFNVKREIARFTDRFQTASPSSRSRRPSQSATPSTPRVRTIPWAASSPAAARPRCGSPASWAARS
jgi:hypothetical protein